MKRVVALLLCLLVLVPAIACAQDGFTVDGEKFTRKFVGHPPNGDKLIEFVRPNETFDHWTKLIGLRYQHLPRIDNDPLTTAMAMARVVQSANPKAPVSLLSNKEKNEAILDFLTWTADGKYMEFNVFRYARSPDGHGVVSLQLAYRVAGLTAENVEMLKKLRISWINQAARIDIRLVHATLTQ